MNNKIAVYGTLRQGYGNHRYHIGGAKFLGEGHTLPDYRMLTVGFPFAVPVEEGTGHRLLVEVYEVDEEQEARVDALEGYPGWYSKDEITVVIDGKPIEGVSMYTMNAEEAYGDKVMPNDNNICDWANHAYAQRRYG